MELYIFYAKWCGPCKSYTKIYEKFIKERNDVKIKLIDIDNDNNKDIMEKYNVKSIPTTSLVKNTVELETIVGILSFKELEELVNKYKI